MKWIISLVIALSFISCSARVRAQTGSATVPKCDGPPDLCAKIFELQSKVEEQKSLVEKAEGQKTVEKLAKEKREQDTTMKLIATAGIMAAVLKALLTALSGWKDYFKTVKGKAWLRAITLVVGFLAFILTNIGFGIPWWQSLIVAGGGPGAILVHELMKLGPAIKGKGPLPSETSDGEEEKDEKKPARMSSKSKKTDQVES